MTRLVWFLVVLLALSGCAARLVDVGRTYYVVWPGQMPDVVEIHRTWRNGWAQCRSVTDTVIWTCNLNTALYLVQVQPQAHPPAGGSRADTDD